MSLVFLVVNAFDSRFASLAVNAVKKKINIDKLEVGMYMEADVRDAAKGKGAIPNSKKNVLLLGSGMLITSENQIRRLKGRALTISQSTPPRAKTQLAGPLSMRHLSRCHGSRAKSL
jgi:hypothetical protein